jgi:hypothetical protein
VVKLLPGVLHEKRLLRYCTKDTTRVEEMGIMDRTYFIRFLREEDLEGIVELGNRLNGDNYVSLDALRRIFEESHAYSFTLKLNEGDGLEILIGFQITSLCGEEAHLKFAAMEKEFADEGFREVLLNSSARACTRVGVAINTEPHYFTEREN